MARKRRTCKRKRIRKQRYSKSRRCSLNLKQRGGVSDMRVDTTFTTPTIVPVTPKTSVTTLGPFPPLSLKEYAEMVKKIQNGEKPFDVLD